MTNRSKLKILIGVMFFFIIVLVAMLIYAKSTYVKNDSPADATISANSSSTASNSSTTDTSVQTPNDVKETIDLKLYFFDADDYEKVKEIRTVAVDKNLYQDDITAAINKVLSTTNININKAVVNGNSITVDLTKEVALKFNGGSTAGITYTNILAATIVNLPDIEKMEVTVDGTAGVLSDHFNFNGIFSRAEEGKKYTFTDSDKEGNFLD